MSRQVPSERERLLLHPVFLGSVVVLLVNDHLLKGLCPGTWWTGKLSDVAGLVFFPVLFWVAVTAIPGLDRPSWQTRSLDLAAALTALVFALVQLTPWAAEAWRWGLGLLQWPLRCLMAGLSGDRLPRLLPVAHTSDPSDLWALPGVLWGPWAVRRRVTGGRTGHPRPRSTELGR